MPWEPKPYGWFHTETGEQVGPGPRPPEPEKLPPPAPSKWTRRAVASVALAPTTEPGICPGCGKSVDPEAYACACGEIVGDDEPAVLAEPLTPTAGGGPPDDVLAVLRARFKGKRDKESFARQLLEALAPSHLVEDDPPLKPEELEFVDGAPRERKRIAETLLKLPRLSGSGNEGSALVLRAMYYAGTRGGVEGFYLNLFVECYQGAGNACRRVFTRGVKINRRDVRPLIEALEAYEASEVDDG